MITWTVTKKDGFFGVENHRTQTLVEGVVTGPDTSVITKYDMHGNVMYTFESHADDLEGDVLVNAGIYSH